MKKIEKLVTFYVSDDGREHTTEKDCKEWEEHLVLKKLHENLYNLEFHDRCKIVPYCFMRNISVIGNGRTSKELSKNNCYALEYGRSGEHGDERVMYKLESSKIKLLIYNTEEEDYRYQFSIPKKWTELSCEELKVEVEEFLKNRKVFVKIVTVERIEKVSYREV